MIQKMFGTIDVDSADCSVHKYALILYLLLNLLALILKLLKPLEVDAVGAEVHFISLLVRMFFKGAWLRYTMMPELNRVRLLRVLRWVHSDAKAHDVLKKLVVHVRLRRNVNILGELGVKIEDISGKVVGSDSI